MMASSAPGIVRLILRWVGRGLAVILALVLLAAVVGFTWQTVGALREARRYPAPGTLIDVGARSLHLYCRGDGEPTVIIEASVQDWSTGWQRPQTAIARHTRVCTYDRAGLGWSEASADPKNGLHMVADLHQLLAAANVPRPVVLVGHSLGGTLNRIYYEEYPEEVAAMILFEPGDPDQLDEMFPEAGGGPAFGGWVDTLASVAARLGVVRWMYRDVFEGKGYPEGEVAATRTRRGADHHRGCQSRFSHPRRSLLAAGGRGDSRAGGRSAAAIRESYAKLRRFPAVAGFAAVGSPAARGPAPAIRNVLEVAHLGR